MDLQGRLLLSMLQGRALDPSLGNMPALQSVSGQAPAAVAPQSTPRSHNRRGSKEGSTSYATSSQKVLNGYR